MPSWTPRWACLRPACWCAERRVAAKDFQVPDAISPYVAKWLARETEMQVALVFCRPPQRTAFLAWGALLHELREALFELSNAQVMGVKSGWWAQELMAVSNGAPRHPLTQALAGINAPWSVLGRELLGVVGDDERRGDTGQAIAALMPLATAAIAVESALFNTKPADAAAQALAIHWLWQRLPQGLDAEDRARIPMHLFARHGITTAALAAGEGMPLLRDWAGELAAALPPALPGSALASAARRRFDNARLLRLAAGKGFGAASGLGTLWNAWRAARAG
jgi:phytoene/squalene synthetase